jgi:hypothetical protein
MVETLKADQKGNSSRAEGSLMELGLQPQQWEMR